VTSEQEGQAIRAAWVGLGYTFTNVYRAHDGRHHVYGYRPDTVIVMPRGTTMPRGRMVRDAWGKPAPYWAVRFRVDWRRLGKPDPRELPAVAEKLKGLRLFSVATRKYLRRRAWRYFRKLGKQHPDRYVAAVSEALALYRDEDVSDGLALLDNWGLVHILFHGSPVLLARANGWTVAPGRSMAELAPSPIFEPLWEEAPGAVVALMARARCRTVVRWAVRRIEGDPSKSLASYPLEGWIGLLGHDDPEVVKLAAEVLRGAEGLDAFGADRWLALVDSASPSTLEVVCELVGRYVRPEEVALEQAARLASLRPLPVARLGFYWLKAKSPRAGEADSTLLGLIEAGCTPLRSEILRWLRASLETSRESILAFLDSRHADARLEGWNWFRSGPIAPDDVETWRRLLESPYDDVRLALVAELESRIGTEDESGPVERALGTDDLRRLWAAVLLNVHRGSRARTPVVRQILRRLEARPVDAPSLLPLLGVALRSARGPERRAGLSAVVRLVGRRAEVEPLVRSAFPELQWT
jgi:hypothetical protein